MTEVERTVERIAAAKSWNERVQAIRRIPERHGKKEQRAVYAEVAETLYKPHLSANFAFVPRREDYELPHFRAVYRRTAEATSDFQSTEPAVVSSLLASDPETLLVFRTIVGYTPAELARSTREVAERDQRRGVSSARLKSAERGGTLDSESAVLLAKTLDELMSGSLWGQAPAGVRSKMDKPDTAEGWHSVRRFTSQGVPYEVFLHQRHMGGAFRQLLDAASEERGAMLETAVSTLFDEHGVPHVRTGSTDQAEIASRFNLTMSPAPDFVVYDPPDTLRAILECKLTNDGGTARDKASRFARLRRESQRLGGVPVFAVLDGLGWERINDALGPVVEECDGRVFTLETLPEMLEVQPFPGFVRS